MSKQVDRATLQQERREYANRPGVKRLREARNVSHEAIQYRKDQGPWTCPRCFQKVEDGYNYYCNTCEEEISSSKMWSSK